MCALLLSRTGLPLDGRNAYDGGGRTPEDLCPRVEFRQELRELAASRSGGGLLLHRPVYSSTLLAGRYAVHSWVGRRVALAQDVLRHRACALKCFESAELLEAETRTLDILGPEITPEVYDSFDDPHADAERQHVLVMQACACACYM